MGVFLVSVNFWRDGAFLHVGSVCAHPLGCWRPPPARCSPALRCTSCSLVRADLVGSSQLLPDLHYFRWDGTETVCFSSSQYLQHQHDVQINIFIPAGVWQLACSCLLSEPRKYRISFPDRAEADITVELQRARCI